MLSDYDHDSSRDKFKWNICVIWPQFGVVVVIKKIFFLSKRWPNKT